MSAFGGKVAVHGASDFRLVLTHFGPRRSQSFSWAEFKQVPAMAFSTIVDAHIQSRIEGQFDGTK